ncbi:uncharacterized protein TNCV_4508171 [Trichonephila clavipes]|nr:uncharacterized protein TNCV_4508171 [Trichonephila clavipes]
MEGKIENVKEQFDERMEEMSQRVKDLQKKLLACGKTKNENKFVHASPVPVPASPVSVKLYTYDGNTNWEVYKIQFCTISEANGWTEGVKTCQLVASLRGKATESQYKHNLDYFFNSKVIKNLSQFLFSIG